MPSAFVDTNILLYAVSQHPGERPKSLRAQELLFSEDIHLSVQVLQEFYVNAIHLRKLAYTKAEAVIMCELWMEFPVAALTVETFVRALGISARFGLSLWDSTIIAAAQGSNCAKLYSEDFNHGQDYGGVCVINPFRLC